MFGRGDWRCLRLRHVAKGSLNLQFDALSLTVFDAPPWSVLWVKHAIRHEAIVAAHVFKLDRHPNPNCLRFRVLDH
jgi:hypothetical protein